ncbi:hypothetical protein SAMN05216228_1009188 [Rhizobium tibeticum]|uniref:Uncharacterized protein n=1 Tax=Rhizobium tibeticum TaxID=501024 RepID=A0ABY1AL57_9HYPH|nr:hypothetical protein SAMN05216228_1009188 [Rhizobium tibeticum]
MNCRQRALPSSQVTLRHRDGGAEYPALAPAHSVNCGTAFYAPAIDHIEHSQETNVSIRARPRDFDFRAW